MTYRFANRVEAGKELAKKLVRFSKDSLTTVLALPRGGVPVAHEVARVLRAPLDVFVVRKLGTPVDPELAMGAVASGGVRVLNDQVIRMARVTKEAIEEVTKKERAEIARRESFYRGRARPLSLAGKTVILVDDGIATGSTMLAAVQAVRELKPAEVVVAVPVSSIEAYRSVESVADGVECVFVPENLLSVGQWYQDFRQTTDEEVRFLLEESLEPSQTREGPGEGRARCAKDA